MDISTAKPAGKAQPVLHMRGGSPYFSCTVGRIAWDPGGPVKKASQHECGRKKRRGKKERKKSRQDDIDVREGREIVTGR